MNGPRPQRATSGARVTLAPARLRVGLVSAGAVMLAALALQPLLDRAWWLPRTLVVVAAITLAGALARALRLPAPLQPLLQAVTLLVSLTLLFARDEARWGVLPGPAALGALRELAAQGRAFAERTVPPAGPDEGLLLLIAAGVGLIALAVDTLGAGLDLPGLTLVPLAALFLVAWSINGGEAPGWAFVAVAAGWLAILSATQRDRAALWSPRARPGSAVSGMAVAAVTTAAALLSGGLVALGGSAQPVRIGTGLGVGGGLVELDALVSLRRSLVSQDDRVVLTYATTAPRPDYLRLAVLEQFDGEQWRPAATTSLGPAPPSGPAGGAGSEPLAEYRLDVGPLTGTALPSPSGAIQSLNPWPVAWDQRTSLPQRSDGSTIEGERIGLVVAPAAPDATTLRAASLREAAGYYPEDVADPQPQVGSQLPELAREITAGAASPFDAAIALQRWFTTEGGFTYSTDVQGGAGEDALTVFLAERVGYCEQFSATMALMARAIGIPARVVVGFTQGRRDGNLFVVRGTDAHAWPELWMGEAGWVRFEPTPGNPTTRIPGYTRDVADPEPTGSDGLDSAEPEAPATDVPGRPLDTEGTLDTGSGTGLAGGRPVGWAAGAIVLLVLLMPRSVRAWRRRRRMRTIDGNSAYREVADTLADLGLGTQRATPRETITAARVLLEQVAPDPPAMTALETILHAVERQRYAAPPATPAALGATGAREPTGLLAVADPVGPPLTDPGAAAELRRATRTATRALWRRATWPQRITAALAPRSVLGDRSDDR
jgi:transglutaminase-like putative cysteine protease